MLTFHLRLGPVTNTAESDLSQSEPNSLLTTPSIAQDPKQNTTAVELKDQETTMIDSAPPTLSVPLAVRRTRRAIKPRKILDL